MFDEFTPRGVRFVMVYIEEAHAVDEWPIGSQYVIRQHTTPSERAAAAARVHSELGLRMPVLLDTLQNDFNRAYSAWPFRYYVVNGTGVLTLSAQPIDASLPLSELAPHVEGLLASAQ